MLENLLRKNLKKRQGWSKQVQVTAYRLYDWQIPQYPFFIDRYGSKFVVYDRTDSRDDDRREEMINEVNEAIVNIFSAGPDEIIWKLRERQKGTDQYEKLGKQNKKEVVNEGQRSYWVNLHDYLDTGLFLDHRPLRNQFQKNNQRNFLNLFSYTCSVGVAAALGGAQTTNVDISKTYLNWGKENYELNKINLSEHQFVNEDVLQWMSTTKATFEVIFLDPPSFSNSKRMSASSFDVLRDQDLLVKDALRLLNPKGVLYFSNNHSKFRLTKALNELNPQNITKETIPMDFHNQKVHWCFKFQKPS